MVMANTIIFLDFDGVLFNTVKEAYATAVISTSMYKTIDEIDFNSKHYTDFLGYRYLVGPAWNYKYILEFLEQEDFLTLYKKKLKSACGMSGADMAKKHTQAEWEDLKGNLKEEIKTICPNVSDKALKDKYLQHYYDFFHNFASDSGNVPSC